MRSEAQTRELAPRGNGARAWPRTHSVWESRRSDGGSEPLCMSSRNESTEGGGQRRRGRPEGPIILPRHDNHDPCLFLQIVSIGSQTLSCAYTANATEKQRTNG